jgi:hypothetical protein
MKINDRLVLAYIGALDFWSPFVCRNIGRPRGHHAVCTKNLIRIDCVTGLLLVPKTPSEV